MSFINSNKKNTEKQLLRFIICKAGGILQYFTQLPHEVFWLYIVSSGLF